MVGFVFSDGYAGECCSDGFLGFYLAILLWGCWAIEGMIDRLNALSEALWDLQFLTDLLLWLNFGNVNESSILAVRSIHWSN
jgi:hypothetical protein